jgi:hypothetical protein
MDNCYSWLQSAMRHWNCEWLVMALAHSACNTTQQRTAAISHAATQQRSRRYDNRTATKQRMRQPDPGMVGMVLFVEQCIKLVVRTAVPTAARSNAADCVHR